MNDFELDSASPFASVGGFGAVDYTEMNKGITPVFFNMPEPDPAASARDGMARFRNQECVRLIIAADPLSSPTHPVTAEIKERFSEQYRRWKETGHGMQINGTPLKMWPLMTSVSVAEFNAAKLYSIEDVAAISDTNVNRIPEGRQWREKALAWVKAAKDSAAITEYAEKNERLSEEVKDLKEQIAALAAQVESSRRARPRSEKSEDAAA